MFIIRCVKVRLLIGNGGGGGVRYDVLVRTDQMLCSCKERDCSMIRFSWYISQLCIIL